MGGFVLAEERTKLIERYRDGYAAIAEALLKITPEELGFKPDPKRWSVREIVHHLADSEMTAAVRLRMLIAQDRPTLQGYDQDRWVSELRYREVPLGTALHQLAGLREGNLALARNLTPAQLERIGRHSERGEESVALMLRLMAGHDLVHRRQMDRILEVAAR